eukprot:TRINITY_DN47653_c0_g1_i1.p1 TRINITY_DN47653_c0_g1~~TRINITY_DN47653_c0_g1_i1.p1  ORF type:complete len:115 (+),score=20.37 TRINITY_DN47653_c0_g1_i1:34-378(+)
MPTVRVEPKVWFSAERTYLHWSKLAMVFAASAAVLMSCGDDAASAVCGFVVGTASFVILAYSLFKQVRRSQALKAGSRAYVPMEVFADRRGSLLLATCLTTVVMSLVGIQAFGA